MLIPVGVSTLQRHLAAWFGRIDIAPRIFAEFEDRARMTYFGGRGTGVFTTPSAIEQGVFDKYGMATICRSRN